MTRVAIFGGGRVGTAMSLEMPGTPVVRRGADVECDVACVCWPAHVVKDFSGVHPLAAASTKVAFCNGVWAVEDGADQHGCCYVRAEKLGDRAKADSKSWRVGDAAVAEILRSTGLGVVSSRDHRPHLWGKALYLLPLALACRELMRPAKDVLSNRVWRDWYNIVLGDAQREVGALAMDAQVHRVGYLLGRLPKDWTPSPSAAELDYFEGRLLR